MIFNVFLHVRFGLRAWMCSLSEEARKPQCHYLVTGLKRFLMESCGVNGTMFLPQVKSVRAKEALTSSTGLGFFTCPKGAESLTARFSCCFHKKMGQMHGRNRLVSCCKQFGSEWCRLVLQSCRNWSCNCPILTVNCVEPPAVQLNKQQPS